MWTYSSVWHSEYPKGKEKNQRKHNDFNIQKTNSFRNSVILYYLTLKMKRNKIKYKKIENKILVRFSDRQLSLDRI